MKDIMLEPGSRAPDFEGKDQNGELLSLEQYRGKKLILYFYPKDMTPGCTVQARNLSENIGELQSRGYEVIGVSADSEARHCRFIEKVGIKFPLMADEDKVVINAYGVWGEKKFMGKVYNGIHRKTFVINEEGVIEAVIDKVKTKSHSQQILDLADQKNK